MEQIGTVARLQIQRQPLKDDGVYDPSWLLSVAEAVIGRQSDPRRRSTRSCGA
ncbi:MAG: hypothetical protein ACE5FS_09100 [Paracoccaceae bacterium]